MAWGGAPRGRTSTAQSGYVEARTTEEGAALLKAGEQPAKRRKMGNVPIDIGGEHYDSTGEGVYTLTLDAMKAAGRYSVFVDGRFVTGPFEDWWRGERRTLVAKPPGGPKDGFARHAITLKPDYFVRPSPDGAPLAALDYKGMRTGIFNLKAILWVTVHPGIPLYIVGKDGEWKRA